MEIRVNTGIMYQSTVLYVPQRIVVCTKCGSEPSALADGGAESTYAKVASIMPAI